MKWKVWWWHDTPCDTCDTKYGSVLPIEQLVCHTLSHLKVIFIATMDRKEASLLSHFVTQLWDIWNISQHSKFGQSYWWLLFFDLSLNLDRVILMITLFVFSLLNKWKRAKRATDWRKFTDVVCIRSMNSLMDFTLDGHWSGSKPILGKQDRKSVV